MTEPCDFCGGPCNPFDQSTWKQVTGWVGGPRKDSMRLREDTSKYAHNSCVAKAQSGIDPKSQPTLEDDGTDAPAPQDPAEKLLYDIFAAPAEEVPRESIADKSFDYIKPDRGDGPF